MLKKIIIIVIIAAIVVGAGIWFLTRTPAEFTPSYYIPGDYFVTNIQDSHSLLKTTIVLALARGDREEFLAEHNHIMRDVIIFVLRDKTEEELRSPDIQDKLREEITAKLSEKLGIDYITTIYFNDFILQ